MTRTQSMVSGITYSKRGAGRGGERCVVNHTGCKGAGASEESVGGLLGKRVVCVVCGPGYVLSLERWQACADVDVSRTRFPWVLGARAGGA